MYLFLIDQKDSSTIDFQAMSERVAPETDLVQCLAPGTLVNLAEKLKPEIIVVDFALLDNDAIGFFRVLRKSCPESHLLVLTDPDNYQNLHMVIEQGGIDEYVFKPFNLNDFMARLHIVSQRKAVFPAPPEGKPDFEPELVSKSGEEINGSEEKPESYDAEQVEQAGAEMEASFAEEPGDLFKDNLSTLDADRGADLFAQADEYDDERDVPKKEQETLGNRVPLDMSSSATGLLLDEDLERIVKKTPAEQEEFASPEEDDFQDLFADEAAQEPDKPAGSEVDLFSDIIAGKESDYSDWDFPAAPEQQETGPVARLDKLPEPFDSEFPETDDSHELTELDLQLFSEPAAGQSPVPSAQEEPGTGVPPPPDLSELRRIQGGFSEQEAPGSAKEESPVYIPGQPLPAGQPAPPPVSAEEQSEHAVSRREGEPFGEVAGDVSSFDQVFTDRVDEPPRPEKEPLAAVDEFESYFSADEQLPSNEFELPAGEQQQSFFEEEDDFRAQSRQKQMKGKSSPGVVGTMLNVFFALVLVFIAFIAFFLIHDQISDDPLTIAGYEVHVYMSDLMKPEIASGSLILVREVEATGITLGDVIAFPDQFDPASLKASRVVSINRENGLSFVTRPDAVTVNDPEPVPAASVAGRVTNTVPFLGHLLDYAQTREGVIMLVFIPGLLIIIYQLAKIVRYFSTRSKSEAAY